MYWFGYNLRLVLDFVIWNCIGNTSFNEFENKELLKINIWLKLNEIWLKNWDWIFRRGTLSRHVCPYPIRNGIRIGGRGRVLRPTLPFTVDILVPTHCLCFSLSRCFTLLSLRLMLEPQHHHLPVTSLYFSPFSSTNW